MGLISLFTWWQTTSIFFKKGQAKEHLLKEDPSSEFWFSYFMVILYQTKVSFYSFPEKVVLGLSPPTSSGLGFSLPFL